MEKRTWKNTFAPDCDNEELTIDMIITGLFRTVWFYEDLPEEIQTAVDEEMTRRTEKKT